MQYTAFGPGFNASFDKNVKAVAGGRGGVDWNLSDFQFPMPDLQAISRDATAQSLAGLSPLANQILGQMPVPPGAPQPPPRRAPNVAGVLAQTPYGGK